MHILICDDDSNVHEALKIYLDAESFTYASAYDGRQALDLFKRGQPDFVVLDIMMPEISGIDVCKEIRRQSATPIIMLTAKGEEIDRILGLELGADDYIVKPFSPREVIARIKVILRRINYVLNNEYTHQRVLNFDKLRISLDQYRIELNGEDIVCTPKETEVLYLLASRPGHVFTREQILDEVWGYDYFGDNRTIDTHIKRLRAKLPENEKWAIITVYGMGYKFEAYP